MEANFKTDEMKSTIESMKQQHHTKDNEMERLRKCACDAEVNGFCCCNMPPFFEDYCFFIFFSDCVGQL
jgi:hypothetical protein